MAASTSKNGDVSLNIEEESKVEEEEPKTEEKKPWKTFAVSPKGDLVVEFVAKENFEFDLQMYDLGPKNESNLDDQKLSYRDLHNIDVPTKFKFTIEQLNSIKEINVANKLWWHINVSEKSTSSPSFRLLTISCISTYSYVVNYGLTFVFIINDDYSISNFDDKELPIQYGGIVLLISDFDGYFLIILTLSGVYKYHIKNKLITSIQKLNYPKRMYNALNYNWSLFFGIDIVIIYELMMSCISRCLNVHYLLVDTAKEGIRHVELYDLKTNQLISTFQRDVLNRSIVLDIPSFYAVSSDGKLLAYVSWAIKGVKIYLINCGLEIAKLENIFDDQVYDRILSGREILFINFFPDDELFVYFSEDKWVVWNIFNTLENPGFKVQLSKNAKIMNKLVDYRDDKLIVYDDLIMQKYFKKGDNQGWKKLSSDYFLRQDLNKKIRDLYDKESELHDDYHMSEPWSYNDKYSRYRSILMIKEKNCF
ncbi:hypothetical protein F8M41_022702 [Gigaspora margarita]|uniref:Uncharacterized protein n=1 Tax=Gigaspora margarita TaxID=4874 RepID=A0A8H4AEQ0_GIGMA|nr:hypothetical protein F8M41_022702 [Gigaspora margarita]